MVCTPTACTFPTLNFGTLIPWAIDKCQILVTDLTRFVFYLLCGHFSTWHSIQGTLIVLACDPVPIMRFIACTEQLSYVTMCFALV